MNDDDFEEYEKWFYGLAFSRTSFHKVKLKRLLDCGHWIDATEPYRYSVWRNNSDDRDIIHQRTDCEFCSRRDNSY